MKKTWLVFICAVVFLGLFAGCHVSKDLDPYDGLPATIPQNPPMTEDVSIDDTPIENTPTTEVDSLPYSFPENEMVFDFSVLPEEIFPRGTWTVNKLINKYGTPEKIYANYLPGYDIVFVDVLFNDFRVSFLFEYADKFSFYRQGLEEKDYSSELEYKDNNLELEILALSFNDPSILFPYGIKIDQSTKAQIMDLYPKDTAYWWKEEYEIDLISYAYAFRDENGNLPEYGGNGNIDYLFDENEVLRQVNVKWFYFDL